MQFFDGKSRAEAQRRKDAKGFIPLSSGQKREELNWY